MNIKKFKLYINREKSSLLGITVLFFIFSMGAATAATIVSAEWKDGRSKLVVKGTGARGTLVEIVNAYNDEDIGSTSIGRKGKWTVGKRNSDPVPVQ